MISSIVSSSASSLLKLLLLLLTPICGHVLLNLYLTATISLGIVFRLEAGANSLTSGGSCNGLILIGVDNTRDFRRRDYISRHLLLWNPSTRQLNHIPPVSYPKPRYPLHSDRYLYGLGYDDSTDDYKIVCIFSSEKDLPDRDL